MRVALLLLLLTLPSCDSCRSRERAAPTSGACGESAWTTYGHDPARTFASDGCIDGPLHQAWRYVPSGPSGKRPNFVFHALARPDSVFLEWTTKWRAQTAPNAGMTSIDRLDRTGARVWSFESPDENDATIGHWPSLLADTIVENDDALYFVAASDGKLLKGHCCDYWGATVPVSDDVAIVNTSHVDGPGLFVGRYRPSGDKTWEANAFGSCRGDVADALGAIAYRDDTIFHAARYSVGEGIAMPLSSGLYALDAKSGARKWFQAATPSSAWSVDGRALYGIEEGELRARDVGTGVVSWSTAVPDAGAQAPVLAGERIIVATKSAVVAFDKKGGRLWSTDLAGAAVAQSTMAMGNACARGRIEQPSAITQSGELVPTTTMLAALGSGTLLVTAGREVHVLALATGKTIWSGAPPAVTGALGNPIVVGRRVYVMDLGPSSDGARGALIALE
jgi:outer membrane protein assembly factor BamB